MNQKKLIILILAAVVLLGGVLFVVKKSSMEKDITERSIDGGGSLNALVDGGGERKDEVRIEGRIRSISEGLLEIEDSVGVAVSLKIDGSTPVFFTNDEQNFEPRQIADLRVSETVMIDYDKKTEEIQLITVR